MNDNAKWLSALDELEALLHARARTPPGDTARYQQLRSELIGNTELRPKLPKFLRECSNLQAVWIDYLSKEDKYKDRDALVSTGLKDARKFFGGVGRRRRR